MAEATIIGHRYEGKPDWFTWEGPRWGVARISHVALRGTWGNEAATIFNARFKVVQPLGVQGNDYALVMQRLLTVWPLVWLWYRLKRTEDYWIASAIFWLWMRRLGLAEKSQPGMMNGWKRHRTKGA